MAVVKNLETTTLSLEVENGVDKGGKTVYAKKSFSGVKNNADAEKINAVAQGISSILKQPTRYFYVTEASKLQ